MAIEFNVLSCGITIVVILLGILLSQKLCRPSDIPPGPMGWPILGSLPALAKDPLKAIQNMRQEYGDVFSVYLGSRLAVFVNGYKNIKDVLITRGDEFIDRPKLYATNLLFRSKGIVSANGMLWRKQKAFTQSTLKTLGLGKSSVEDRILQEAEALLKSIEKEKQQPFSTWSKMALSATNVICSVVFSHRFDHEDSKASEYIYKVQEIMRAISISGAINFLTWLRFLPGDLLEQKATTKLLDDLESYFKEEIEVHKQSLDCENIRDFIDAYLVELQNTHGSDSTFSEEQLVRILADLFLAGTETTGATLQWSVVYMVNNPEIQQRVYDEIIKVVGNSRLPRLADGPKLLYTQATLLEIQRLGDVVPLDPFRVSCKKTTLQGYSIPKGTIIIPVLGTTCDDAEFCKNGDTTVFNPSRFLDSQGQLVKHECLIPFSAGKRVCLGESVAKMELFVFFTAMVQRFHLRPPPGYDCVSTEAILGANRYPKPFKVQAVLR